MECCDSGNAKGMKAMMGECMKKCRWCPFIPLTAGLILFLLGYFLGAEVIRLLWLVSLGLAMIMGIFCLIMMSTMRK